MLYVYVKNTAGTRVLVEQNDTLTGTQVEKARALLAKHAPNYRSNVVIGVTHYEFGPHMIEARGTKGW